MKKLTKINLSKLGAFELDERELNLVKGGAKCACVGVCSNACRCSEGAYDAPINPSVISANNLAYQHDYDNDDKEVDIALMYTSLGL